MAGLSKIGKGIKNFFRGLFGGPSESELQGREFVADFEETLSNMLTDTQRLETGNVAWKNTIVAIRDRYLELGLTNEEALRDTERLWASSREGAEAAMRVIEEIKRKMEGGIHVPVVIEPPSWPTPPAPDYTTWPTPVFHSGGVVPGLVARPIMALGGEGVLSHRGMRSIGGPSGLAALNRGAAPTGDINLYVNGYLDSKQSALHLARLVRTELDQELQRRRRMSRG